MASHDEVIELPINSGRPSEDERNRALMALVREGDRNALQTLLERFWEPLLLYAADVVGYRDDAEDIVQETFLHVWRNRASWYPTGTVGAYLYRITRNLSLNAVRSRRTREKWSKLGSDDPFRNPPPPTAEEEFEMELLREEVEAAIATLPERRREIFILSRYHGLTHREIAGTLGISVQTVSNQMGTALSDLRRLLAHRLDQ